MFRNSGENALNRLSLVSFFIGAERDSLHTFSADVFDQPVIKRLWTFGSLRFVSTVPYSTTDKSVCR